MSSPPMPPSVTASRMNTIDSKPRYRPRRALVPSAASFATPTTSTIVVTTGSSNCKTSQSQSSLSTIASDTSAASMPFNTSNFTSAKSNSASSPTTLLPLRACSPGPQLHLQSYLHAHRQLRPSTPKASAQHIAAARAAVIANISNVIDPKLQDYAYRLHSGQAAIAGQQSKVQRATAALSRENDAVSRLVSEAERKVKELGSLRNWAEVLEQEMMVLECTVKIVRGEVEGWRDVESGDGRSSYGNEDNTDEESVVPEMDLPLAVKGLSKSFQSSQYAAPSAPTTNPTTRQYASALIPLYKGFSVASLAPANPAPRVSPMRSWYRTLLKS
ncbi:hypothetical protein Cpir12675_003356 [Ceratocystis pirilliformis]|uniref:Biogenesis of lysosome-related organelles complex 1 subunit 1 n=1 Tax=Ceratocystis pirilliformis TaxID=259994 RepID=A0ABR3Z3R2_9PEZI